jgi:hypothetical protein
VQIPQNVRFQVSLPIPLIAIGLCIHQTFQVAAEPIYEAAILRALGRIQKEIPLYDLAIQWNMPGEIAILENVLISQWFTPGKEGIIERIERLAAAVNGDVELGFHLCYSDSQHRHFVEPKDTTILVELANIVLERVERQVDWIHVPIPKDRHDTAYFAPLKLLKDLCHTKMYLGLVHAGDEEPTRRRIQAASQRVQDFGVATECGMGRTRPAEPASIMQISAAVSEPGF